MVKRIRNVSCLPHLSTEGRFKKPILSCEDRKDVPCPRISTHHTLASIRRHDSFVPYDGLVPKDSLDFVLTSTYDQSKEIFPDAVDVYIQPETLGKTTWKRLRNNRDLTPERTEKAAKAENKDDKPLGKEKGPKKKTVPYLYNFSYKIIVGGVTERVHPSSVKLMNTSHHSPQTNAGYSRQDPLGTFYQY